jgi:predicted GIY-YIG superfamily endonuclease
MKGSRTSFSWRPNPTTGLSGEKYLSVAMEAFVDDLADAHQPGVYVLELSNPVSSDYEAHTRLWLEEFEVTPEFLDSVAEANKLLYVGAAEDVYERLQEHLESPNRSTKLSKVFPIHSIKYIHLCESAQEAFLREDAVATDLQNNVDGHVHSR